MYNYLNCAWLFKPRRIIWIFIHSIYTHPATDPNPSNMQYIGWVVLAFSFRFLWSYDENIRALYYHHYNIWNVNHKPLFGGRPCNNGMCSMVYYVLIHHDKNRLNTEARIKMSRLAIFAESSFGLWWNAKLEKKHVIIEFHDGLWNTIIQITEPHINHRPPYLHTKRGEWLWSCIITIIELHNWLMERHEWIMKLHNWIMEPHDNGFLYPLARHTIV